jgi:DinB superfamily
MNDSGLDRSGPDSSKPDSADLNGELRRAGQEFATYFGSLPPHVYFAGSDEQWSPAHHVRHLTLSNRPLTQALRLPRLALLAVGGRTEHGRGGRDFATMREMYLAALQAGGRASGRFLPTLGAGRDAAAQASGVADFQTSLEALSGAVARWPDADLDGLTLPHPLLGRLTLREMLYFAVYHHSHHLEGVRRRLPESEQA